MFYFSILTSTFNIGVVLGFKRISMVKTFLLFLSFGLLSLPLKAQQETILYFDFKEEIWNLEGDPQKDGVFFWNPEKPTS